MGVYKEMNISAKSKLRPFSNNNNNNNSSKTFNNNKNYYYNKNINIAKIINNNCNKNNIAKIIIKIKK